MDNSEAHHAAGAKDAAIAATCLMPTSCSTGAGVHHRLTNQLEARECRFILPAA